MIKSSLLAIAFAVTTLAALGTANADTRLTLQFGNGAGYVQVQNGWDGRYPDPRWSQPGWGPRGGDQGYGRPAYGRHQDRLSPREVRRVLRHQGYDHIDVRDARGRTYLVIATGRRGAPVKLVVDAFSGQVLERERLRRW